MTSDWSSQKKTAYHWRSRRVELENGADSYQWRLRDAGPAGAATLEETEWRKENEEMEEDRSRGLPHVSLFLNGNWNLWFSHNYL